MATMDDIKPWRFKGGIRFEHEKCFHEWFDGAFQSAVEHLNWQAGVGDCCLKLLGSTVALVFGWDGFSVNEVKYNTVKAVVLQRFQQLMSGDLVADPINLFIKDEPHKLSKISEGRLRLISGVSLIDGIVDRMLFGEFTDSVLDSVGQTPVLIGWNPAFGGGKFLLNQFPDGVVSVDKSSWDWSVPGWLIDLWLRVILELYSSYPAWYVALIKSRFILLFERAAFSVGGGESWEQGFKGVMKSGCFLTLILNSLGQLILHYIVAGRMGMSGKTGRPWCVGDDTVQNASFDFNVYGEHLKRLGFEPKVGDKERFIEFVGFLMDEERTVPAYWKKHLFLLKYMDEAVAVETLRSYSMLYRDEPEAYELLQREMAVRSPSECMSREMMKMWVKTIDC